MQSLRNKIIVVIITSLLQIGFATAQSNLLLNGGFEDVNTCTEYSSECGVEGWFYLKDVKAQMLSNETNTGLLGNNSFGIFYNWGGYTDFTPVIGALLPCGLQKGNRYTFKGIIAARLNPKLNLKPGVCLGEKFYVPKRPFATNLQPEHVGQMKPVPNSNFYSFEYSFVADGNEQYLTFGTYTEEDTLGAKKKLVGTQTISLVLDNFQLIPEDSKETNCPAFVRNKEKIYTYNSRHKDMDYSLYGKGGLNILLDKADSLFITTIREPVRLPVPDTLKLGDVFFDFNKANLKPAALTMLEIFFVNSGNPNSIDSIYIEGHTDSIGTDSRNLQLSLERCESIRQWLLKSILTGPIIHVQPFGRSKPVASNSTPQGRALNRRVELVVFRKMPLQ